MRVLLEKEFNTAIFSTPNAKKWDWAAIGFIAQQAGGSVIRYNGKKAFPITKKEIQLQKNEKVPFILTRGGKFAAFAKKVALGKIVALITVGFVLWMLASYSSMPERKVVGMMAGLPLVVILLLLETFGSTSSSFTIKRIKNPDAKSYKNYAGINHSNSSQFSKTTVDTINSEKTSQNTNLWRESNSRKNSPARNPAKMILVKSPISFAKKPLVSLFNFMISIVSTLNDVKRRGDDGGEFLEGYEGSIGDRNRRYDGIVPTKTKIVKERSRGTAWLVLLPSLIYMAVLMFPESEPFVLGTDLAASVVLGVFGLAGSSDEKFAHPANDKAKLTDAVEEREVVMEDRGSGSSPEDGSDRKTGVMAVDVGGTKELITVVGVTEEGELTEEIYGEREIETIPDTPENFYLRLAVNVEMLKREVEEKGVRVLPLIGIGSPGRFIEKDGQIVMAPGSAANLGNPRTAFDNVSGSKIMVEALRAVDMPMQVFMNNDAIAQMSLALSDFLKEEETARELRAKKVAYEGPGTGLGGGFARMGISMI